MTSRANHPDIHHASRSITVLRSRALFVATAAISALAYTICVVFVAIAPQTTMAFFSYIFHADLSNISRSVSIGSFLVGLLVWSLGTGFYAALIARLYNRLT